MANAHLRGAEPAVRAISMLGPGHLRAGVGGIYFAIQLKGLRVGSAVSMAVAPHCQGKAPCNTLDPLMVQSGVMVLVGALRLPCTEEWTVLSVTCPDDGRSYQLDSNYMKQMFF